MATPIAWQSVAEIENWCAVIGTVVTRLRNVNTQLLLGADRDVVLAQSVPAAWEAMRLRDMLAAEWKRQTEKARGQLS